MFTILQQEKKKYQEIRIHITNHRNELKNIKISVKIIELSIQQFKNYLSDINDTIQQFEQEANKIIIESQKISDKWKKISKINKIVTLMYKENNKNYQRSIETYKEAVSNYNLIQKLILNYKKINQIKNIITSVNKLGIASVYKKLAEKKLLEIVSILACKKISTKHYLQQLERNLSGKKIIHIIPQNLGGAEHPANYHIVNFDVHRHWRDKDVFTKCVAIDSTQCFYAVLTSVFCGSFLRK